MSRFRKASCAGAALLAAASAVVWVAGAASWRARLAGRIAEEYRVRRAMRELRGLDDKLLRDIGRDPGGIERVAWFWRD